MSIISAIFTALVTIMLTRSWGEVTTMMPSTRQGLEHRQRHVAGSGRHIHEQIVHLAPDHVGPELLDGAGDDRAAPDDRGRSRSRSEQVQAHDLDAGLWSHAG